MTSQKLLGPISKGGSKTVCELGKEGKKEKNTGGNKEDNFAQKKKKEDRSNKKGQQCSWRGRLLY